MRSFSVKTLLLILLPCLISAQGIIDTTIVLHERLIYFDSDVHILSEEDKKEVLELVCIAKEFSSFTFYVDAYTDDVGSQSYNLNLSDRRKKSIVDLLLQSSIHDSMIVSNFHGEDSPVSLNVDDASRQLNRRAIVQLLKKKQLIQLSGVMEEDSTGVGIIGEVSMRSKDFNLEGKTDSSGHYSIMAPLNEMIVLEFSAKDYFFDTKTIKTSPAIVDKLIKIPMAKLEMGKKYVFKDMLFQGDMAIMLERSKPSMTLLEKFMFVNTEVCIEIEGHINKPNIANVKVGTRDHDLSIARSLVVQNALKAKGVHPDRILSRGYGNWFMVFPFAKSDAHQERNRRVEIKISHCDTTRLVKDDVLENLHDFMRSGIDKYYNEFTVLEDIQDLPPNAKKDFYEQIRKMESAQLDPRLFTIKQILSAHPELPSFN